MHTFDNSKISQYYENCKQYFYSQKYDGVHVVITSEGAKTRNGNLVANPHLREILSALPEGLIGEIAAQDFESNYALKIATSLVMDKHSTLNKTLKLLQKCKFYCFNSSINPEKLYLGRMTEARYLLKPFIWAEVVHLTPLNLLKVKDLDLVGEGVVLSALAPFDKNNTYNFLKVEK